MLVGNKRLHRVASRLQQEVHFALGNIEVRARNIGGIDGNGAHVTLYAALERGSAINGRIDKPLYESACIPIRFSCAVTLKLNS